jgi:hypothetical protein
VTYGKFIQFVVIKKCEFMLVRAGTPEGGSCLTYMYLSGTPGFQNFILAFRVDGAAAASMAKLLSRQPSTIVKSMTDTPPLSRSSSAASSPPRLSRSSTSSALRRSSTATSPKSPARLSRASTSAAIACQSPSATSATEPASPVPRVSIQLGTGSAKAPVPPLIRATSRSGSVKGVEARAVNASRDAALAFLECDANEDGVLDWHEARPPTERGIVASTRRQHPRL